MFVEHLRSEAPLISLLIPQIIGILLCLIIPINFCWQLGIFILIPLILLFLFYYLPAYQRVKWAWIRGALLYAFLIGIFYLLSTLHNAPNSKYWYKNQSKHYEFAIVKVAETPQIKPKTFKLQVEVQYLLHQAQKLKVNGKVILYLQYDTLITKVKVGDLLCIKNLFNDLKSTGNPGAFEYANYCNRNQIYQSAYLPSGTWRKFAGSGPSFTSFISAIGLYARNILRDYIPHKTSLGIAEALLLGYRKDIDADLWQSYADTGIVHIIAISGMHMAMIYMSLKWVFSLLPFFKKRNTLSILISLLLMWLFACITGLPPSVNRAALMFTFIGFGDMIKRDISAINNLAASAFLLLCINPNWLADIGFQLSYMAVLSLVIFYKKVYNAIYISNKIIDLMWKMMSATLAAQILTLPLCLYYFHQFPLLFILTNLIAVPLTTIVLYAEILLVNFHTIKPLATCLGKIISYLIKWLNEFVLYLSRLPFAVWDGYQLNIWQTILCYTIILSIATFLIKKYIPAWIFGLACTCILVGSVGIERWQLLQQKKVVLYQVPKHKAIEFISGSRYFSPDDSFFIANKQTVQFVQKPAHRWFRVHHRDSQMLNYISQDGIEYFKFYSMCIIRISQTKFNVSKPLPVDYLILSGQSNPNILWITKNFIAKNIVLDSSIPFWRITELQHKLNQLNIPIHIIHNQGALVIDID